jgi:hypothetical protein
MCVTNVVSAISVARSAYPPRLAVKADIPDRQVVPFSDSCATANSIFSFDHIVGASEERLSPNPN